MNPKQWKLEFIELTRSPTFCFYEFPWVTITYIKDDKIHRPNKFGPARFVYYDNKGILRSYSFWEFNKEHRDESYPFPKNGPALTVYYQTGTIMSEFYIKRGLDHRVDGPAFKFYYENGNILRMKYFINDKIHRNPEEGYANIEFDINGNITKQEYYVDNKCINKI